MNDIKAKFSQLDRPVRLAILVVAGILGLLFLAKILPALIAAMGLGLLLSLLLVPYWLPTIVAFVRKHPNRGSVLALNFFLGWTFIGWVVALVWSLSDTSARGAQTTVIVNNNLTTAPGPMGGPPTVPAQYTAGDVMNGQRADGLNPPR